LELKKKLLSLGEFNFSPLFLNQCLPDFPGTPPTKEAAESGLSGQAQELYKHYATLLEQESDAVSVLGNAGLEIRKLPRLSCPEWITTVEAISEALEHS
jgi:hypothetical protein